MVSNTFFDTTLYIDLRAIQKNYLILKEKSFPAICAATVKANSYGLGVTEISNALYEVGCKHFFVATLGEAIFLRRLQSDITIHVFHGIKQSETEAFLGQNLIPVLNDIEQIRLWNNFAKIKQLTLPAIIHFDTGINRLGIDVKDANIIKDDSSLTENLDIKYTMTHLACSNEIDNIRNQKQLDEFNKIKKILPSYKSTIANSSAIFLGNDYLCDMVRPGAALFGINPTPYLPHNPMNNVIRLTSKIIQIKTVQRDGMVGYGNMCPVTKGMVLATVAIGYADGYLRSLTNRSYCYLKDKLVPTLGKISMDMIVIDISSFKKSEIKVGDEVEIIGNHIDLSLLSKQAGTIPYEILTSFSARFKKIYIS